MVKASSNIFFALLLGFAFALVPYCADIRCPIDCPPVSVVMSEALAAPTGSDLEYINIQAEKAGMDPSDYVAWCIYGGSVSTGNNFNASGRGVSLSYSLSKNLSALTPSRDFPDWDTLTSDQQSGTTEDEYNAARFNSYMVTIGKVEAEDYRLYKIDPTGYAMEQATENYIKELGRQAYNVITGTGSTLVGNIKSLFNGNDEVNSWLPVNPVYDTVNGNEVENWPSDVPTDFKVSLNTEFLRKLDNGVYWTEASNVPVYGYAIQNSTSSYTLVLISIDSFKTDQASSSTGYPQVTTFRNSATQYTLPGGPYYWFGRTINRKIVESNFPIYNFATSNAKEKIINNAILYGPITSGSGDGSGSEIEGYPQNVNPNTLIIFPGGGFTSDTPWEEIISNQQIINDNVEGILDTVGKLGFDADGCLYTFDKHLYSVAQNFNFYVSGNNSLLRVYDEQLIGKANDIYELLNRPTNQQVNAIVGNFDWPQYKAESEQFQASLQDVAPFCSIWLAKMVVDQIALVDPVADAKFEMPFGFFGQNNEISIDLNFLDAARPFFNFFTIALLVLSLARGTMHFLNSELV